MKFSTEENNVTCSYTCSYTVLQITLNLSKSDNYQSKHDLLKTHKRSTCIT